MRYAPLQGVGKVPVTLLRRSSGQLVKGQYVESLEEDSIKILANIQPAKYHDLLILPESLRSSNALRLYSTSEIRTLKEGINGWLADEFIYEDERYRVFKVQAYKMGVLNHYKAIAYRFELTQ